MTSDTTCGISVFIPVYNEEAIIEANTGFLIRTLNEISIPYEIIIGSNGSTDRTVAIIRELSDKIPSVRWFHLSEKGVGKAFCTGVQLATYSRIITVDMDISIDLDFIETASRLLETHDIIVGSKINGTQKRSLIRTSASNCFISLASFLLGIRFTDYSIAAKAYRKETIMAYVPYIDDKTFYVVRILFHACHDGKSITEIPVKCHDMRKSRFNLVHEGLYKFGNLFLLWATSLTDEKQLEIKNRFRLF